LACMRSGCTSGAAPQATCCSVCAPAAPKVAGCKSGQLQYTRWWW
jgi:hypothetical protein